MFHIFIYQNEAIWKEKDIKKILSLGISTLS